MTQQEQNVLVLALQSIDKVGPITARSLISYCGGIEQVFKVSKSTLLSVPGVGPVIAETIASSNPSAMMTDEMRKAESKNVNIISYLDKAYPNRLKHHETSPIALYSVGNIDLNPTRTVGIVGTRKPTTYGKIMAQKIVEGLKELDVSIISGLAYGIDTVAHQTAVDQGISTIAVLGNGLSKIYPATNSKLAHKMMLNGGLVSEFGMDMQPNRENFPMRNRIIAALSDAVVVVESAKSGGSIITAEFANQMNKDVFAVPSDVTKSSGTGCNQLIKTNKAHLLESAADIAYIMGWDKENSGGNTVQRQLFQELEGHQAIIYNYLKDKGELSFDAIHMETQMPVSQLSNELLTMEFQGIIKSLPGKMYIAL